MLAQLNRILEQDFHDYHCPFFLFILSIFFQIAHTHTQVETKLRKNESPNANNNKSGVR